VFVRLTTSYFFQLDFHICFHYESGLFVQSPEFIFPLEQGQGEGDAVENVVGEKKESMYDQESQWIEVD